MCGLGYKDVERPGGEDVRGTAEGTGPVQPGEEEAEGRPHRSLQLPRSSPHGMRRKRRRVKKLLALLFVVFLILLVVLVVVCLQSRSSHPQFSHVCPDTWISFQSKCYYFSENESNWNTSLEKCKALEASLTSIHSQEELVRTGHEPHCPLWCGKCVGPDQNPIFPQISPTAKARRRCPGESTSPGWGAFIKRYKGQGNHWFGLHEDVNGQWRWTNGTAFNNRSEVRGGGPCAYLNQEKISSALCDTEKYWICSKPNNYVLWRQKIYPE